MNKVIHHKNPEVVAEQYDNCIGAAPNGTIYALSWYLNITCPDWEFLSTEDFSTVMPLPVFKSMGRKILKQPDFTYQLGVFSTSVPDPELIQKFLLCIPRSYRLKNLCMNKFNQIQSRDTRQYGSCELDLIRSGKYLSGLYGTDTRAALDKAKTESLTYLGNISVHKFLEFSYQFGKETDNYLSAGFTKNITNKEYVHPYFFYYFATADWRVSLITVTFI